MNPVPFLLASLLAAAQPQPFAKAQQDALLDFRYGWPAVVEEEPALRDRFSREMQAAEAQARREAQEDQAARQGSDAPFHNHVYSREWESAGSTAQLLSLTARTETYTGGAHGNLGLAALLWDRSADREADTADLLGPAALQALAPRYCARLNAMRSERRGEPVRSGGGEPFTDCPPLPGHPLAPADKDGNGRFETLRILIGPYEAGPWVEGAYIVELPLEPGDLAALPEAFRPAFEVGAAPALEAGERG
ncbi:PdaC/SigV domain-containing protein [Sphingosinicella sp. CPCC 101087]|uniref:PdaC/SigV domain-containing protein n=1 Tax=Sphingosinicella sp. CPCC 101087 TaxID=2497754 RepID=UPI00101C526E|nr:DUF4163 domain-containing protein [Sphingosinicella sp. CPCC 101087]